MPHQISFLFLLTIILLTGCATTPQGPLGPPPAFPPPPEAARFVYDGTLRSSRDVREASMADKLKAAATGTNLDPEGLLKPYGVVARQGRVYVSDTMQRAVVMFDMRGRQFKLIGVEGPGTLVKPMGLDISSQGELFVADITAKRIVVFDLEGRFLRAFGNDRLLNRPSGVTLSPDGRRAYVVETGGIDSDDHHLLIFNAQTGELLKKIGQRGRDAEAFNLPLQATTVPSGHVYVVDSGNFRIQKLDAEGRFVGRFGTLGRRSGQFSRPKGIASDPQGNIYVVDTAFGNFQIFDPQGQLLLFVGDRGSGGGPARYMLPAGIDVDEQGRIYVVDQFFRKVDIFRPAELAPLENIPQR